MLPILFLFSISLKPIVEDNDNKAFFYLPNPPLYHSYLLIIKYTIPVNTLSIPLINTLSDLLPNPTIFDFNIKDNIIVDSFRRYIEI